jgi:hypothetical protein
MTTPEFSLEMMLRRKLLYGLGLLSAARWD